MQNGWKVKHNIGLLGMVEAPCVVMRQCIVMSPVPCHRLSSYPETNAITTHHIAASLHLPSCHPYVVDMEVNRNIKSVHGGKK